MYGGRINLFRGYGYAELMGKIIIAIAIGIVLALLVAITKNRNKAAEFKDTSMS